MAQEYDAQLARAWDDFCDSLKGAKDLVFRKSAPTSETVRADGMRYLAQYIGKAMDEVWNFREPMYPQLFRLMTPTAKSFGDNPDCTYLETWIDGSQTYRVVGNRGSVTWVSFL